MHATAFLKRENYFFPHNGAITITFFSDVTEKLAYSRKVGEMKNWGFFSKLYMYKYLGTVFNLKNFPKFTCIQYHLIAMLSIIQILIPNLLGTK